MKKAIFVIITALILTSLMISCGGGTTSTPSTSKTAATSTAASATTQTTKAATTPKSGGIFKTAMAFGPSDKEIGWPFTQNERYYSPCYDTLFKADYKGEIKPWLATDYNLAADLSSITLTLRKDVTFNDGSAFDADVAKWNLEQYKAAGKPGTNYWQSIDVIDPYTVKITLSGYQNTLLELLSGSCGMMESKASFDKNGEQWMKENPVGSGPFKFVSLELGVKSVWTKNPNYWAKDAQGNQLPYLDGVETWVIPDEMTRKAALIKGDLDMVYGGGTNIYGDLQKQGFEIITRAEDPWCLWPSSKNVDSPWANKLVREAVDYGINHEAVTKVSEGGFAEVAYQLPPKFNAAYNPDLPERKYDTAKAKELLAQAGYTNGFQSTIICANFGSQDNAVAVQSQLAEVGINLQIKVLDIGAYMDAWMTSGWEGVLCSPCTNYVNFAQGMQTQLGAGSPEAASVLRPDGFDKMIDDALATRTLEPVKVQALIKLIYDNVMTIPVYYAPAPAAVASYVKDTGYLDQNNSVYFTLENTWLNK
jgi:peptide/nickel transport system substrate-binding protein